ncbi:MAG: GNAT family N-acetyltransferase [Myxococcales bacterium]|nr:GNAT family N-acetyltransferase [Myxococcales bacterium]MCB9535533.1 GNAT family N-acetyltransferase [Myxococcales bacterium]
MSVEIDDALLEGLTALRHDRFARHRLYRGDEAARAKMRHELGEAVEAMQAAGEGDLAVLPGADGPRAAVLWWVEEEAWHGAPAQHVWVDHAPDTTAIAWTCAALDAVPRTPHFDLHLDALDVAVRRHLLAQGLGIDSVMLAGEPERALEGLMATDPPPETPPDARLRIDRLGPADIEPVLDLSVRVFQAEPQWCWFGAQPAWIERQRKAFTRTEPALQEVLRLDGRIVGLWGSNVDENPFWGRTAGMNFVLAPEVRGQGLGKIAYRRLLEWQVALGVDTFKGGTNRPEVMHLARRMGREPIQTWIRSKAPFGPEHFASVLEPTAAQ